MRGHNYLVAGEEVSRDLLFEDRPQTNKMDGEVITTVRIWQCKGGLFAHAGDPDGKLKDLFPSFALFKLLQWTVSGYKIVESGYKRLRSLLTKAAFQIMIELSESLRLSKSGITM